jgi:hypothetical protein
MLRNMGSEFSDLTGKRRLGLGSKAFLAYVAFGMVALVGHQVILAVGRNPTFKATFYRNLENPFGLANLAEAILWLVIALIFAIVAFRTQGAKSNVILACIAFALFGISDLFEIGTGAWWRPFELLALKAGCIVVFVTLLGDYYWNKRRGQTPDRTN